MGSQQSCGLWIIRAAETTRGGPLGEWFEYAFAPLIDARISSYTQGVAEIELKTGERSQGFVFADKSEGLVSFWFDERVGRFDQLPLLNCSFHADGVLISDDGTDRVEIERIAECDDVPPVRLRDKILARRTITLDLLKKSADLRPRYTSSDGKAREPGIVGARALAPSNGHGVADHAWRKQQPTTDGP